MDREIVKIINEICREERIGFKSYSADYILKLEKNHRTMFIYGNKFPNNSASIEQICNDKAALSDLLKTYKIPHVEHVYFDSPAMDKYCPDSGNWQKMVGLLKKYKDVGIVCKPNKGTGGRNVYKVRNQKELEFAVWKIFDSSNSMSISRFYNIDNEFRVLMLGDEVQYIFRKIRPYIIGDGIHSIRELTLDLDSGIAISDEINLKSIPSTGEKVDLSWKHNLGQGATPEIVSRGSDIFRVLSALAKRCVAALGLGFVSIDIIQTEGKYLVLEINSGVMIEKFSAYSEECRVQVKLALKKAIQKWLHLDTKYYITSAKKSSYVLPILYKIAKKRGVQIIEDTEEMNFAIFIFPNGKSFVAKDYPFNINTNGSSSLTTNKNACNCFIKNLGYNVPIEKYFVRKSNITISLNEVENSLLNLGEELGLNFPVVVKPNNLSQGVGVSVAYNVEDGVRSAQEAFLKSKIILLQQYCSGHEFRIVVLHGTILQAYERIPFSIKGNGRDTIYDLIQNKIEEFKLYKRDKNIDPNDARIFDHIDRAGYTYDTILLEGEVLKLQDIANLSLGGTSVDIADAMDIKFKEMAIDIATKLNLTLCGIDIIANDISNFSSGYHILEVNSSPGLDNYLYHDRKKQNQYVEMLYGKVFEVMEKL